MVLHRVRVVESHSGVTVVFILLLVSSKDLGFVPLFCLYSIFLGCFLKTMWCFRANFWLSLFLLCFSDFSCLFLLVRVRA
jgi:hypothetical protein